MTRPLRERTMPLMFEIRDGRRSRFVPYEKVLQDRACGRRVVRRAMDELDSWRRKYGRLFESLNFADWHDLTSLLEKVRGERPQRSATHARARKDRRYAQETFYEALAGIDAWRRTYGYLFERLRYAPGRRIACAVEEICRPRGGQKFYVWTADA